LFPSGWEEWKKRNPYRRMANVSFIFIRDARERRQVDKMFRRALVYNLHRKESEKK